MAVESTATGRTQYWEDILDITAGLKSFGLAEAPVYLKIDSRIYPRFPSSQTSVRRLLEATSQTLSQTILEFFQSKCVLLQEETLSRYRKTVANMESLVTQTGIDDRKQQAEISSALQTWYERSESELISTIKTSLGGKEQTKDHSTCGKMEKLHQAFNRNPSPNDKEREVLAEVCGMSYKQVTTWFQNQRQRSKPGRKYTKRGSNGKNGSVARDDSERQPSMNGQIHSTLDKGLTARKKSEKSKGRKVMVKKVEEGSTSLSSQTELRVEGTTAASRRNTASSAGPDISAYCGPSDTTASSSHPGIRADSNLTATLPLTSQNPGRKIRKLPTARNQLQTLSMHPACGPGNDVATESSIGLATNLAVNSRVPSLTRSVSTASGDSEVWPTDRSESDGWTFTGYVDTAKDRTVSASDTNVASQGQQLYESPLTYRPIRRMREQKTPRALPAPNTVDADREQHVLPSMSAMLPLGVSPARPPTFQMMMMMDERGDRYLVPVASAIQLPAVSCPLDQQPQTTWQDEHEKELRSVSYAIPESHRFEKLPTPAASVQSGSRLSTPETSTETTPSPYQTPKLQVKHTASMTIGPAVAGYAVPQSEQTMSYNGSPADIPLPAPTYDELYPTDPRLKQQTQYQSDLQSDQALLPEVSVEGVPFSFAEPDPGSYMIDDETLRDMESLLRMDAGATGSFDTAVDVSPVSTQSVPYEEKNEGQYTQYTTGETREESSPGSEGTVELVGLQGSSGLIQSSASQPVYSYDYATSSAAPTTADCGPLSGPSYAPPQSPTPAPSQVVDHTQGYPLTVYPPVLTSNSHPVSHSRGVSTSIPPPSSGSGITAGETPFPQFIYSSMPQYAQQPQYVYSHPQPQVQVQPQLPMQMQMQMQVLQPSEEMPGWNYQWEWGALPFEGADMGEMFTLDQ